MKHTYILALLVVALSVASCGSGMMDMEQESLKSSNNTDVVNAWNMHAALYGFEGIDENTSKNTTFGDLTMGDNTLADVNAFETAIAQEMGWVNEPDAGADDPIILWFDDEN